MPSRRPFSHWHEDRANSYVFVDTMTECSSAMGGTHCSTAIFRSRMRKAPHNRTSLWVTRVALGVSPFLTAASFMKTLLRVRVITNRVKYPTVGQPDRCDSRSTTQTDGLACTSKSALLHILPFYRPSSSHFLLERTHGFSLAFNLILLSIDYGSLHRRQRLHGKLGFCGYWYPIHHTNQMRHNRYQNGSY
jgi:hypothetical protein